MKKIFFVAIAATLLAAGCQKTEILNQVSPAEGSSMTFAPDMGKLTKSAEGQGLDNLKAQDFRLWAYYDADDANRNAKAGDVYDKMKNIKVFDQTSGETTSWKTTVDHFWPGAGKKLRFFAVSANEAVYGAEEGPDVSTHVEIDSKTGLITISDFVVDNNADVDLMIADTVIAHQTTNNKTVNLKFRHALAKVQFQFKNEMAKDNDPNAVIVQHMYVNGVETTGTVAITGQSVSNKLTLTDWTPGGVKTNFYGDFTKPTDLVVPTISQPAENLTTVYGGEPQSGHEMLLTDEYQAYTTWLVIPQALDNSETMATKVTIAYLIGTRQFVATFPLYRTDVTAWNPNQFIKYNVSLSPNLIGFNATVEDWTTDPSNGADINN